MKLASLASRKRLLLAVSAVFLFLFYPCLAAAQKSEWVLAWSDEFDGANGSQPDPAKWELVRGGGGFGNNELQSYTTRPSNAHLEDGNLVITALKENMTGPDGIAREYTSARMQTKDLFAQQYGRFEARIKIPKGQGIWPAFWMLGTDIDSVNWPKSGEIDIMENIGKEPGTVHGTIHGPGYSGGDALTAAFELPKGEHFSDAFHVFAVEWAPKVIRFYVDDRLYATQTADTVPAGQHWVFEHPFYVLLNVAVGGYWPGNPDATTQFPTSMLVDYVRVYKEKAQ